MRDVIFISHANPEDNRFTVWLATQLVREGYKVWCDVTKLLCGDDMWNEIESILRVEAIKFIFVGSNSSNQKPGALKELHLATVVERKEKLIDFVLPIVIDDLPFSDLNIEISRLMAASFREGWAKGLAQLLARLEKDQVPRSGPGPQGVASWWRQQNGPLVGVREIPETCWTNWYRLSSLPEKMVIAHPFPASRERYLLPDAPYPVVQFNETGIASLSTRLDPTLEKFGLVTLLGRADENGLKRQDLQRLVVELIRRGWEKACRARGLQSYPLSNRRSCFYFTAGQVPDDQLSFVDSAGKKRTRNIVGFKTIRSRKGDWKRWWHAAFEGKVLLRPFPVIALRLHILFSSDGKTIWSSALRLHRARRSQGSTWWNAEWRDRGRAFIAWLACSKQEVAVPSGANQSFRIESVPVAITAPVSFPDPGEQRNQRIDLEIEEDDEEGLA